MSDVTIIISNYNYAKFVTSCIDSCLVQKNSNIIVVDDASTDRSWKAICKYVERYKVVTGVRLKKNSGGNARGKNVGIGLAKTEYIICLDADDMLRPESVEPRLRLFKTGTDLDFVHGWSIHFTGEQSYKEVIKNKKIMEKPFRRNQKAINLEKEKFSPRWSFAMEASTIIAKRKLYEKFGLYDEEMGWSIDREMSWRWLDHGARIGIMDEYVSLYRRHKNQLTQDRRRKDPKKHSKLLSHRQIMRKAISLENTLLLPSYDHESYIAEIK